MSYTKQGFYEGMTLEHTHLINMEDGIINATSTQIPDYWQSYMENKVKTINTLNESSGGTADTFIFITDTHFPAANRGKSVALMKYIIEHTSVNKIFFGGDIIHVSDINTGLATARQLNKDLKTIKYHMMRGNHDSDANLSKAQLYDCLLRTQEPYCEDLDNKLYYYTDNKAQKIRYIITDSIYSMGDTPLTDEIQMAWMKEKILELSKDWTVLVIHHNIWLPLKTVDKGEPSVDAQVLIDALDSIYDEAECTIAGIWAGHCHRDNYEVSDKGYALITTTCDCYAYSEGYDLANPTRPAGTTNEQAFDVVNFNPTTGIFTTIRIGAGEGRSMSYTLKGRNNIDLSSLTWEQGHYDGTGADTGTSNSMYNYRIKSNVFALPSGAQGKTLYFNLSDGYEINFRAGTSSNPYEFNYYYITSDKSVADRGVNSGNRGYVVTLPSNATHIRMMLSKDDGNGVNNITYTITPSDAANAGLQIWYYD